MKHRIAILALSGLSVGAVTASSFMCASRSSDVESAPLNSKTNAERRPRRSYFEPIERASTPGPSLVVVAEGAAERGLEQVRMTLSPIVRVQRNEYSVELSPNGELRLDDLALPEDRYLLSIVDERDSSFIVPMCFEFEYTGEPEVRLTAAVEEWGRLDIETNATERERDSCHIRIRSEEGWVWREIRRVSFGRGHWDFPPDRGCYVIVNYAGYERSELARRMDLVAPGEWIVEVERDGEFAGRRAVTIHSREEVRVRIDGPM